MTAAIIIGLTLLLAAGLALLLLGLRGRRINDHPICRGCGFDLVGVLPAGSTCPECGAGIKSGQWVRTGARQKRAGMAEFGGVLAAITIVPLGLMLSEGGLTLNLLADKPTAVLLEESDHAALGAVEPVLEELQTRWTAGTLTKDQKLRIIASVLEHQRDLSRPWSELRGDLFERGRSDGLVTEDQFTAFQSHSAAPELRTRGKAEAGQWISFGFVTAEHRQSSAGSAMLSVHVLSASLGGRTLRRNTDSSRAKGDEPGDGAAGLVEAEGTARRTRAGLPATGIPRPASEMLLIPADMPPGEHELQLEVALRASSRNELLDDTELLKANQQRRTLSTRITILPPRAPIAVVPMDAQTRSSLEAYVREYQWESRLVGDASSEAPRWSVSATMRRPAPAELVAQETPAIFVDVYVVDASGNKQPFAELDSVIQPDQEAGRLLLRAATGSVQLWTSPLPDPFTLSFEFRQERSSSPRTLTSRYGGERIVIENIPVRRTGAADQDDGVTGP